MPTDQSPPPGPISRLVLTPKGVREIEPPYPSAHYVIDRHWELVAWFFATGDAGPVRCFTGMGIPFASEPADLRSWVQRRLAGGSRRTER